MTEPRSLPRLARAVVPPSSPDKELVVRHAEGL